MKLKSIIFIFLLIITFTVRRTCVTTNNIYRLSYAKTPAAANLKRQNFSEYKLKKLSNRLEKTKSGILSCGKIKTTAIINYKNSIDIKKFLDNFFLDILRC